MLFSRNGNGKEQIGNTVGIEYVCPLGCKHSGAGYCVYTGSYSRGLFHGYGELQCVTGRYYKGEWCRGDQHGQVSPTHNHAAAEFIHEILMSSSVRQGEEYFIKDGEMGDSNNLFIGGLGSLYRMKYYKGEYQHGVREGAGLLTYTNGDTIDGVFKNGHAHGTVLYTFATTGKTRLAKYENSYRVEWISTKLRNNPSRNTNRKSVSR